MSLEKVILILLVVIAVTLASLIAVILHRDSDAKPSAPPGITVSDPHQWDRPSEPLVTTQPKEPQPPERPAAPTVDAVSEFFKKFPEPQRAAVKLDELKGNWQVRIMAVDLGPDVPSPDVADAPTFSFSIGATDGGFVLTPEPGKGLPHKLTVEQHTIIATAPERPPILLRLAGNELRGSVESPTSGRMEFNATRLP